MQERRKSIYARAQVKRLVQWMLDGCWVLLARCFNRKAKLFVFFWLFCVLMLCTHMYCTSTMRHDDDEDEKRAFRLLNACRLLLLPRLVTSPPLCRLVLVPLLWLMTGELTMYDVFFFIILFLAQLSWLLSLFVGWWWYWDNDIIKRIHGWNSISLSLLPLLWLLACSVIISHSTCSRSVTSEASKSRRVTRYSVGRGKMR